MGLREKVIFPKMEKSKKSELKDKIFSIIFEADTPYGKLFDIFLLFLILFSVGLVMLESIPAVNAKYHLVLVILEWIVTLLFTIEIGLRIYCVKNPWRYIFSFYGLIDILSILPTYIVFFYPAAKYLVNIRILRLFRVFRIFGLTQFMRGRDVMVLALKESRAKIVVFLSFITLMVVVIGTLMYIVEKEHPEGGFSSIPQSIYWAVVTLTTVGYGDISPVTPLGKFIASLVMIMGYGVIAVPTGIVSMETFKASKLVHNTQVCQNCGDDYHLDGSVYCKTCGHKL